MSDGWLPMLSGVNGASLWAADASLSAVLLVEAALGRYSSRLLAECGPPDEFDEARAASLTPDHPNVWMVALFWIMSQVFPLQVLGSTLISRRIVGVVVGGVMLIVFGLRVRFSLAGAFVLFLDPFSQSNRMKCGVSFWLCSLLLLFIWVLTIWEWFVMLDACRRTC